MSGGSGKNRARPGGLNGRASALHDPLGAGPLAPLARACMPGPLPASAARLTARMCPRRALACQSYAMRRQMPTAVLHINLQTTATPVLHINLQAATHPCPAQVVAVEERREWEGPAGQGSARAAARMKELDAPAAAKAAGAASRAGRGHSSCTLPGDVPPAVPALENEAAPPRCRQRPPDARPVLVLRRCRGCPLKLGKPLSLKINLALAHSSVEALQMCSETCQLMPATPRPLFP